MLIYIRRKEHTIKKNTEALVVASKETGLEENADKSNYMVMSRDPNARQSHDMNTDNYCFESVEEFKYLGTILTNQNSIQEEINPLKPELNPICYLLALLGVHHFLHVTRIRVKLLNFRRLMSYIYGAPILDVSRSHTTTQHSR